MSGMGIGQIIVYGVASYFGYSLLKAKGPAGTVGTAQQANPPASVVVQQPVSSQQPAPQPAQQPSTPSTAPAAVAADGQYLGGQSPEVIKLFQDTWGPNAAQRWAEEHNRAIGAI